jgi:hypothetical protein
MNPLATSGAELISPPSVDAVPVARKPPEPVPDGGSLNPETILVFAALDCETAEAVIAVFEGIDPTVWSPSSRGEYALALLDDARRGLAPDFSRMLDYPGIRRTLYDKWQDSPGVMTPEQIAAARAELIPLTPDSEHSLTPDSEHSLTPDSEPGLTPATDPCAQNHRMTECIADSSDGLGVGAERVGSEADLVRLAVERSLLAHGQKVGSAVWTFARTLKGYLPADVSPGLFEAGFQAWFDRCGFRPDQRDALRDKYRINLRDAKTSPDGNVGFLFSGRRCGEDMARPGEAWGSREKADLVNIFRGCWALSKGEPFPASQRGLALVLGVEQRRVREMLFSLEADGVITKTDNGDPKTSRAATWSWAK